MTEDHVFIDSLRTRIAGRDQMKKGWEGYFGMVPEEEPEEALHLASIQAYYALNRWWHAFGGLSILALVKFGRVVR
jgi:ketosteroid isomerase-like protein